MIGMVIFALALLIQTSSGQLFPFSTLRQYIDQKYAESGSEEVTTNPPPPVDTYRLLEETSKTSPLPTSEVQELKSSASSERTVLVTPKPKYVPQRLVPEPDLDPNSVQVPSIGFTITSSPIRPSKSKDALPSPSTKISKKEEVTGTIVESVPSLSVTIHDGHNNKGLIDYLTPPKYPSVYENHMKLAENINSLTKAKPLKTKKKKNKRRQKDDIKDSERSSSENRVRLPPRTSAVKKKVHQLPFSESHERFRDPIEPQSSESHFQTPPPNHKFDEEFSSSTFTKESIGLGPTGERVEFQLHGQSGPESYKFGFDTGDSKNRHFRYEEKDDRGKVKGHYGYYDKTGKLQIMNYSADENGFHASPA